MPLSWIIIILAGSFLVKPERLKSILRRIGFALLLFFTNPLIVNGLLYWWEVKPIPYQQINRTYHYGVVLTGIADLERIPDDRIHFNASVDRINHTIELYKKGLIEEILISGGSGSLLKQELKEAPKLKEYAIASGVPADKISIEGDSRNTHENAVNTVQFLKEKNLEKDTFLLITSAFHMRRASASFDKEAASFVPFTTGYISRPLDYTPDELFIPSLDALSLWHLLIREWFGMAAYKISGYI